MPIAMEMAIAIAIAIVVSCVTVRGIVNDGLLPGRGLFQNRLDTGVFIKSTQSNYEGRSEGEEV